MDKNSGETPNPLNPASVAMPTRTPNQATNGISAQPTQSVPVNAAEPIAPDPTNRPMEQVVPVEKPVKKKKTGLIITIIMILVALVAGGIAIAMMLLNKTDPVTAAMNKIMSGNAPENVVIDGTINIATNYEYSPISSLKIDLKSSANPGSLVNESKAILTADIKSIGELSVEFDEVYAGDGDLYFKIDGVKDALQQSGLLYMLNLSSQLSQSSTVVDCGEDEYCQTDELQSLTLGNNLNTNYPVPEDNMLILDNGGQNMLIENNLSYLGSLINNIEVIDGEWIRISISELKVNPYMTVAGSDISCITNLVSKTDTGSNSAAELYKKNPFITSTDKNITLASKKNTVYKVSIDSKNLANFINSIQNSNISGDVYSCLNLDNTLKVDTNDLEEKFSVMPDIYTEIDKDNNFTRLYLESNLEDELSITIDLNFSYPTNINVSEPDEYVDFSSVFSEILSSMFILPVDNYTEL